MLALLGCSLDEVRGVLTGLGYKPDTQTENLTSEPNPNAALVVNVPETAAEAVKANVETPPADTTPVETAPESAPTDVVATAEAAVTTPKPAPKPKKTVSIYHPRETNEAGETVILENLEYWHFPSRGQKGFKPKGQGAKRQNYRSKGKPDFKKGGKNTHKSGPKPPSKKQIENSPFAALAALKNLDKKD